MLQFKSEMQKCVSFVKQVEMLKLMNQFSHEFKAIHIPNERMSTGNKIKDICYANKLKSMGMLPGVSDYIILYKNGWAALEFKLDAKGKLSPTQKTFKDWVISMEMPYLCTFDIAEAISFIKNLR